MIRIWQAKIPEVLNTPASAPRKKVDKNELEHTIPKNKKDK